MNRGGDFFLVLSVRFIAENEFRLPSKTAKNPMKFKQLFLLAWSCQKRGIDNAE